MKRILIAIGLVTGISSESLADFDAGRDAYIRGDFAAAYQEFLPPATRGDAKSRIGLGLLHAHGHGVRRDFVKAHKWFDLAATQPGQNHPVIRILARTNRDYLAKQMSTAQIAESKIRAALIANAFTATTENGEFGGIAPNDERYSLETQLYGAQVYSVQHEAHAGGKSMDIETNGLVKPAQLHRIEQGLSPAKPVRIQLAAIRDGRNAKAMTEWKRLSRRHSVLTALRPVVSRIDLGTKGVFQRLRAGPFDTQADARHVCSRLRAADQDCFVVLK